MATAGKRLYATTDTLKLPVISGTVKGSPVAFGRLAGVAQSDRDSDGNATVQIEPVSVHYLSVTGYDDAGSPPSNAAISAGDDLYLKANSTVVSADNTGTLIGVALEDVGSGDTEVIKVAIKA